MIWSLEHWISGDNGLKFTDGISAFWHLYERHILLYELLNWLNYLCVSLKKGAVVAKKSQSAPDIMMS